MLALVPRPRTTRLVPGAEPLHLPETVRVRGSGPEAPVVRFSGPGAGSAGPGAGHASP